MTKQNSKPKKLKYIFNSPHDIEGLKKQLIDMCVQKIENDPNYLIHKT